MEKGELLAFGSARPRTEERYDTGTHTTYFGHAQAVVRLGASGSATLKVRDRYTEELTSPRPMRKRVPKKDTLSPGS